MKILIVTRSLFFCLIILSSFYSCSHKLYGTRNRKTNINEQIVGTWQLCNMKDSLVITNYNNGEGQNRYKFITPESFSVVDFSGNTKILKGAFMGSYSIDGNIYREVIQYTGTGYQRYLNENNSFSLNISGNYMTIVGINNDYGPELWKKIKCNN